METFEKETDIFILRIWFERRDLPGAQPAMRGVLEQVTTGKRAYFARLQDIPAILKGYFQDKVDEPPENWYCGWWNLFLTDS